MHPTPQEQLDAAIRLITAAAEHARPAGERDDLLRGATVLLRRLSRSLDARMPFLADDNERARVLLQHLRADVASLAPEIDKASAHAAPETDEASARATTSSESHEHSANLIWQGLLARAVTELADDEAGDRGRAQIAAHLRARTAANPALNREPIRRPQPTEEPRV